MYRYLLAGLLAVGVLSSSVKGETVALFTHTGESAGNKFTAGSVTLGDTPTTALISFSNLVPGDVVTSPLTVQNTGNLTMEYTIASTVTNATLGAQLTLRIRSGVTTCTTAAFDSSGTNVYGSAGSPGPLGSSTNGASLSLTSTAIQVGAGTNQSLCFQAALPSTTAVTFEGLSTTATFTFSGLQVIGH